MEVLSSTPGPSPEGSAPSGTAVASDSRAFGGGGGVASGWDVRVRWLVVALCLAPVALAWWLAPAPPGGALTVSGVALPEACGLKRTMGLACPGCGLTRSWVSAMEGDLAGSFAFHPLGWLLLLYAMAQAVRHLVWLGVPPARAGVERAGWWLDRGVVLVALLLLLVWLPRVAGEAVLAFGA